MEWTSTPFKGGGYVLKGGSWQAADEGLIRAEWAGAAPAEARDSDAGFRCVVDVAP
jgi:formylglycine-generating enzyme required for sulfatase activity